MSQPRVTEHLWTDASHPVSSGIIRAETDGRRKRSGLRDLVEVGLHAGRVLGLLILSAVSHAVPIRLRASVHSISR